MGAAYLRRLRCVAQSPPLRCSNTRAPSPVRDGPDDKTRPGLFSGLPLTIALSRTGYLLLVSSAMSQRLKRAVYRKERGHPLKLATTPVALHQQVTARHSGCFS